MPHKPKPPIRIVAPSFRRPAMAASAFGTRLSIMRFEPPKDFIDLVGDRKLLLELAAAQAGAEVFDHLYDAIERGFEIIAVGEHDVAPNGIGAAGQAQRVTQAAAGEGKRQAGLVGG